MTANLPGLRVAFVPGVTLRKWTKIWDERYAADPLEVLPLGDDAALAALRAGEADLAFLRLPVEREGLNVIPLYSEAPTLVVSRDSEWATRDSVDEALVGQMSGVVPFSRELIAADAVALVAAGVGSVRLPHSLARLHARRDVVAVSIVDAAETSIALVWRADDTDPRLESFIGIVRGRTAASSRGGEPAEGGDRSPDGKQKAAPKQKQASTQKAASRQKAHRVTGNRAQARGRKNRQGR